MIVRETLFTRTEFIREIETVITTWLPETEHMTDDDFIRESIEQTELVERLCPKKAISNSKDMRFTIAVPLQEWTAKNSMPRLLKAGLTTYAIIVPEEMIAMLAIEQTMEETTQGVRTRYFSDEEVAMQWLLTI